ncbi:MAG: LpxI family protein [Candidatus Caldatribacterium sp.]|uniref:LpxI family protein n=1 Tax=Candidatus Caldatribacterium sp. TaxID=2282143 RepID=UPI002991A3B5|nr:LpxI family protein [Candidatus Caldatribacterium sp.]MCX7730226.1 LpxI family protein [Candidatus Caldatribacterium sp.]MDW8080400.1 LpxI family protein [Candidatus Calescibacterium sp.]
MLLLAGEGVLPVLIRREAEKTFRVVVVSCRLFQLHPQLVPEYLLEHLSLEELSAILKKEKPEVLCLAGKVPKVHVFASETSSFFTLCRSLRDRDIVEDCIKFLRDQGVEVLSPFVFLKALVTQEGVLFGPPPTEEEWWDIEYGFRVARFLADEEIGQTVVVKRGTIVALEGAEGTDETIRRGLALARGGIVVKVARSHQNFLVDIPAVGAETIRVIGEGKGRILALESGKTLLVDRHEVQSLSERFGVTVLGVAK